MGDWRVVRIGYGRYDDGGYRLWSCSGQQEHGGDDCLRDNNSTTGVKRSTSQRSHRFHSLCRGGRSAVFFVLMPFVSTASSRSKQKEETGAPLDNQQNIRHQTNRNIQLCSLDIIHERNEADAVLESVPSQPPLSYRSDLKPLNRHQ